jgi:hypothetical protein
MAHLLGLRGRLNEFNHNAKFLELLSPLDDKSALALEAASNQVNEGVDLRGGKVEGWAALCWAGFHLRISSFYEIPLALRWPCAQR